MFFYVTPEQVGLAVDDIKAVQEQAALKRLAMQVFFSSSISVIFISLLPIYVQN